MRIWIVSLPAIPGADLRHHSLSSAQREIRAAVRKGLGDGASLRSVYVTLPVVS